MKQRNPEFLYIDLTTLKQIARDNNKLIEAQLESFKQVLGNYVTLTALPGM